MNTKSKLLTVTVALLLLVTMVFAAGCTVNGPTGTTKPSTAITLDKETLNLDADISEQLTVSGADEVIWASDNEAVATVDENGTVTGVNAGTCKVTASTKDGRYQAECIVTVTGYHLSQKVVSGINKIENNTYNGEINYVIDNSDENAFVVSYDRSQMTNKWTSLVLWYDCSLDASSFELEFEIVKGSLPVMQFEFGGESSFKQFERYETRTGKNTIKLNTTDLDLDGEGSWKAIYLELNNPCPLDGTKDEVLGETVIKFTKIAMVVGEKTAPAAPANAEVKDGIVYWDRVLAAAEYELEVDGVAVTDLGARTRHSGDAPVMRRAYKPTDDNAFTAGEHTAKIRSKNSAGVSDWTEFTFTIAGGSTEKPTAFGGITGTGNNQWNHTPDFYTATVGNDGSIKIGFTAAAGDDEWNTFLFNFDKETKATKLHIKLRLASGDLEKVRYQIDRWDSEANASVTVYGEDLVFVDGVAELTVDVESAKLAASNGSVMLYLNKYATAGLAFEIEVIDVGFTTKGSSTEDPTAFRGITGTGNNQWNHTPDFYTATVGDDGSIKIGFTAAADDEWSTFLFNFDKETKATKLHIKLRLASGDLEKVRYQIDRWDSEANASVTVYGEDLVFVDGVAELTVDVESAKLASSNGSVMLFLNKYATAGLAFEIEVIDISLL